MEEISDTNDNKNRKCKVLQHCNGDEKMKTLETESSWIEFQGNNNNVNDKAIMKTVNGEIGNVGDRSAETCSNKPATLADTKPALSGDSIRHRNLQMANGDGHVAETINGSSHEPSKAEVKIVNEENSIKPVAASVSSDAIDNNDDQIVVDGTDDSIDTNDTDADEELDDYSTDNISFVSDADFGNNLIDDLSLLENPSEDDVSNVSENVVYQYRGADFEDVRPAADDDNDFLEMDYEPDPASEVEQDINMPSADVNTGFVSPFNPCRYHVHDMVNPNDVISVVPISVSEWLNNHNVDLSGARRPDSNISAPASSRQMEDHLGFIQRANRRLEDVAGPSDYGSNGRATTRGIYYDNTVTLSTKKYTGTIPKVSRIQSQSRSCRPKPTAVPTSPTKSCCKSMPLICLACIENPSYPLRNAGPRNPCDRCFSLQSVTGDIDCNDNNDDAMDQYYPIDGVSTKRSRSFPVVNRHSNRFPECIKLLRSSLRAPSNLRCSPGRGDLKDQPSTSKQADTEEAREVAMARFKSHDYATIFSVGFNEKSIVAALVSDIGQQISWYSQLIFTFLCSATLTLNQIYKFYESNLFNNLLPTGISLRV